MAIEDEIVNISDLDVGSEILKTDKLIVETNNGTKLLDFKDFVIGIDNISFYHLISGRGINTGNRKFETIGGYQVLHLDTDYDHKPTYEDLMGSIELTKLNFDAYTTFQAISSIPEQNQGDIQNILAYLGEIIALLETPQNLSFRPGAKLRLQKVKSWKGGGNPMASTDGEWYDGRPADLEVKGDSTNSGYGDGTDSDLIVFPGRTLGTGGQLPSSVNFKVTIVGAEKSLVSDNNLKFSHSNIVPADGTLELSPFSMVYPSSSIFTTSTISFDAYIEITSTSPSATPIPIFVYVDSRIARKSYPLRVGNTYIYDFSFVDKITSNQTVLIKYGTGVKSGYAAPKVQPGSSFSGIRMF